MPDAASIHKWQRSQGSTLRETRNEYAVYATATLSSLVAAASGAVRQLENANFNPRFRWRQSAITAELVRTALVESIFRWSVNA